MGPFTWCGLTVFVAVAGSQQEDLATTEYRRDVLSEHLRELRLPLDIPVPEALAPEPAQPPVTRPSKEYTLEEVSTHKQKDDVWIAVEGRVLDVTSKYIFIPVLLNLIAKVYIRMERSASRRC